MAKQLVPVGNEPILFYGLRDMAAAGIEDIAIVISPETGGEVRRAVGDGSRFGIRPHFIVQDKPLGLAHALGMALPWVDGDDVLMYLGDNLIKGGVADVVRDFEQHRPNAQILLTQVDDPTQFGVAELDDGGRVVRLVEKPSRPPSDLALVGVYLFDAKIQTAVQSIKPSARGELEITDAIQYLLESGNDVRQTQVRGWWKDTGQKDDLLHANELVLRDIEEDVQGELVDCTVRGRIRVGADSRLVDCIVTGPAVIGSDVHLTRVTIGPNTAVGDGCRASDASIEDSIVMADSEIHGWRIHNSLLGRASVLHGSAPAGFVELTLGERSEIIGE
jgi:glucose-1-phosphate thymidylyltransferase